MNTIRYARGLKCILEEFISSQNEIKNFVNKCKYYQNNDGFIKQSFFEIDTKNDFKFLSGPFTNLIFKVIKDQRYSFDILLGKFKTTVPKDKYIFSAV